MAIEHRRRHVAALKLRGLTDLEISEALAQLDPPCVNPETRAPWSRATIRNDVERLRQEWRDEASRTTADHKSAILAELKAVKRAAHARGAMGIVLKAIEQECKLFGLNAPIRIAPATEADEDPTARVDLANCTPEQIKLIVDLGLNVIETTATPAAPTPAPPPSEPTTDDRPDDGPT